MTETENLASTLSQVAQLMWHAPTLEQFMALSFHMQAKKIGLFYLPECCHQDS